MKDGSADPTKNELAKIFSDDILKKVIDNKATLDSAINENKKRAQAVVDKYCK
jgi:hypothetical protein